jgi:hypothetical protein
MPAFGEPTWNKPLYRDFTGGENLKILPEAVLPNQVLRAQNCVITNEGLLETRLGKTRLNATSLGSGPVISAHRYSKENGTRYIVAQHGTSLYAKAWDGVTPFTTFGAAVKTGLNAAKLRSLVWKDKLFLTNGVDQAFTFDGTACTDATDIPLTKILVLYAGRLWAVDEATGFLENSNLEDYTDWSESGSYKVRDGEGDSIVALSPQNGGMVIFKQNSVQTLYGTNKNNIVIQEPFSRRIGCIAVDSVLEDGFFMAKDNFYTFTLSSIAPLPETHTPMLEAMTLAEKKAVFAVPHTLLKRAIVNMGTTSDLALCLHAKWGGAITSWANLNAACFAVADDKDDSNALIIGDATEGRLFTYGGDRDDTGLIETRIKSAYLDHQTTRQKEWSSFIPEVEGLESLVAYRMYYNYDVDFATAGGMLTGSYINRLLRWGLDRWDQAIWGAGYLINEPFFLHDARGNRVSFETVCANRIRFNGFTTKYRKVGASI